MAVLAVGLLLFGTLYLRDLRRRRTTLGGSPRRILFPFVGRARSRRALEAALRLARADGATLVPVFLIRVPMNVPLDSPLRRQCALGMSLLETIEQRAFALGVPVEARVERGRTVRHALREAIATSASTAWSWRPPAAAARACTADDIGWLLEHARSEVVIVRPVGDDHLTAPRRPRRHVVAA